MTASYMTNMGDFRAMRELVERYPLALALALSLLVHTSCYGFYVLGKHYGWWDYQATWLLQLTKKKAAARIAEAQRALEQQREVPLEFVEVLPSMAVPEAPKDAKYYAAHNARATNPDATVESTDPKLDGQQKKMIRTEDVPKPKEFPLQPEAPSPPKPKAPDPAQFTKINPEELRRPGVATLGAESSEKQHERPRRLVEVQSQNTLTGQKTQQDGGVKNRGAVAMVDAKGTPFGSYDHAFIQAVQQRWYDLLETTPYVQRSGKVVLEFWLNQDGRITNMQMTGNEVGDLLGYVCERAVTDPAPFPKWPDDMRKIIGKTYREVTFTFYYN